MVLRDSLVLDLTGNPDFSQVESDDPQVTVNQRFEVFFPEKRPFFLENADYFRTPINLFYSRRIVDPSAGVRLTGKMGDYSFGLLSADDRAPGLIVSPSPQMVESRLSTGRNLSRSVNICGSRADAPVSRQTMKRVCHTPRRHSHPATLLRLRSVPFTVPACFVRCRSVKNKTSRKRREREKQ